MIDYVLSSTIFAMAFVKSLLRELATVKNSMVNAVFPICPIVELPNLCCPNT